MINSIFTFFGLSTMIKNFKKIDKRPSLKKALDRVDALPEDMFGDVDEYEYLLSWSIEEIEKFIEDGEKILSKHDDKFLNEYCHDAVEYHMYLLFAREYLISKKELDATKKIYS